MGRDVALLRKVRDHCVVHPEEHDQSTWWCGTSRCIAGWIADLTGAEINVGRNLVRTPGSYDWEHPEDYARRVARLLPSDTKMFYFDNERALRYLDHLIELEEGSL